MTYELYALRERLNEFLVELVCNSEASRRSVTDGHNSIKLATFAFLDEFCSVARAGIDELRQISECVP